MGKLVVEGGDPVRRKPWPLWPPIDTRAEQEVLSVLRSGRWAISGFANNRPSEELLFSHAFAAYNEMPHCIPTTNGTSALMCALQAVGVGAGDEVIVPGLTWVACASAVAAINAIPVLVDIDTENLCLSPSAVRSSVTRKTRAIMAVHLYAGIADLGSLLEVCREVNLPLVEDCAQAHGAVWSGKRVGSWGAVGTFSMQQGKVLTCGEGGACITADPKVADLIYRLRTDGRRLRSSSVPYGRMELEDIGGVFGQNYCLSEIHAALLRTRLLTLDLENQRRADNAMYLSRRLSKVSDELFFQQSSDGTDKVTIYHFPIRFKNGTFFGLKLDFVAEALSAELNTWIHRTYPPLDQCCLYQPLASARFNFPELLRQHKSLCSQLPNAHAVHDSTLLFHHSLFLGTHEDMDDIVLAFVRLRDHALRMSRS